MGQLKREIRQKIMQTMTFERQMEDEELAELIDQEIANMSGGELHLKDRLRPEKFPWKGFRTGVRLSPPPPQKKDTT